MSKQKSLCPRLILLSRFLSMILTYAIFVSRINAQDTFIDSLLYGYTINSELDNTFYSYKIINSSQLPDIYKKVFPGLAVVERTQDFHKSYGSGIYKGYGYELVGDFNLLMRDIRPKNVDIFEEITALVYTFHGIDQEIDSVIVLPDSDCLGFGFSPNYTATVFYRRKYTRKYCIQANSSQIQAISHYHAQGINLIKSEQEWLERPIVPIEPDILDLQKKLPDTLMIEIDRNENHPERGRKRFWFKLKE